MNKLVVVFALLLLTGCGASKTFESVQTGPRASVTFTKVTNYGGAPEGKFSPKMGVGVFEPDADCDLHETSRFWLQEGERSRTVVMSAGRVYLGMAVFAERYLSQQASFLLEDGREYLVRFNLLPSENSDYIGFAYTYYRLDEPDRKEKKIEVDHFSVCKRERQKQKN